MPWDDIRKLDPSSYYTKSDLYSKLSIAPSVVDLAREGQFLRAVHVEPASKDGRYDGESWIYSGADVAKWLSEGAQVAQVSNESKRNGRPGRPGSVSIGDASSEHRIIHDVLRGLSQVVRQSPTEYAGRCPAHEDATLCLRITESEDGRVSLVCDAGCSVESICRALELDRSRLSAGVGSTAGTVRRQTATDNVPALTGATTMATVGSDPIEAFDKAVAEKMKSGLSRRAATRAVVKAHPEMHRAMLAAHNEQHGRSKAAQALR